MVIYDGKRGGFINRNIVQVTINDQFSFKALLLYIFCNTFKFDINKQKAYTFKLFCSLEAFKDDSALFQGEGITFKGIETL